MTNVNIEIHDDVIEIYNKLKNIEETGIEIELPEGSVLFDNIINLKLLKKLLTKDGKVLTITTTDTKGNSFLEMIEEGNVIPTLPYETYTPKEPLLGKVKAIKLEGNTLFGEKINL